MGIGMGKEKFRTLKMYMYVDIDIYRTLMVARSFTQMHFAVLPACWFCLTTGMFLRFNFFVRNVSGGIGHHCVP